MSLNDSIDAGSVVVEKTLDVVVGFVGQQESHINVCLKITGNHNHLPKYITQISNCFQAYQYIAIATHLFDYLLVCNKPYVGY